MYCFSSFLFPAVQGIQGLAFLWFIGVLRDRIRAHEGRFLAVVFLDSGLLFLAIVFSSSAVVNGLMMAYEAIPAKLMDFGIYRFARTRAYELVNVYALRMAGVFMFRPAQSASGSCPAVWPFSATLWPSAPQHRTLRLGSARVPAVDADD